MKIQKTIYHILVDKSGSMSDCIDQTINGFNEQIAKIREMEVEFQEQLMTIGLTTFNTDVDHLYYMKSVEHAYKMNNENYVPDASTAMLDAVDVVEQMSIRRENSIAFEKRNMKGEVWVRLDTSMRSYYDKKRNGDDIRKLF